MAEERITIEIEGKDDDAGELRLSDFIRELEALGTSLRRTQAEVTDDANAVSYRVTGLSYASPYRVTVGIRAKTPIHSATPRRIARRFTSSLRMVRRNHRYARAVDPEVLESMKGLVSPISKTVKSVNVYRETEPKVVIDQQFSRNLDRLTATAELERDEIAGRLEQLNVHSRNNQFHIYPSIGPKRILCKASMKHRDDILANAGKRVLVEGLAHYRKDFPFPHEITVTDIFPLPQDKDLPLLSDLHGIAPGATGDLSPEDFVRELRDVHW
jgi:hypothetical protein